MIQRGGWVEMRTVTEEATLQGIADRKEHEAMNWELLGPILPGLKRSVWHKADPVTLRE